MAARRKRDLWWESGRHLPHDQLDRTIIFSSHARKGLVLRQQTERQRAESVLASDGRGGRRGIMVHKEPPMRLCGNQYMVRGHDGGSIPRKRQAVPSRRVPQVRVDEQAKWLASRVLAAQGRR